MTFSLAASLLVSVSAAENDDLTAPAEVGAGEAVYAPQTSSHFPP